MAREVSNRQIIRVHVIGFLLLLFSAACKAGKDELDGFYAFEEASSKYQRPPKVRKPPYMRVNFPCPTGGGGGGNIWRSAPKFTLCGDLNKGFIPLNPLGQDFDGEPYPFDLIKNKTLHFFSKALPYLTKDSSLPKVAKYGLNPLHQYSYLGDYGSQTPAAAYHHYRFKRQANTSYTPEELQKANRLLDAYHASNARQACDQGGASGLLCTVQSLMSNRKVQTALVNAVAQGISAITSSGGGSSGTAQTLLPSSSQTNENSESSSMTETLINLVSTLASMGLAGSTKNDGNSLGNSDDEPSSLAHVMSVLTGASPGSHNALSLVLKLMASEASPLKAIVGGFQRRKPAEDNEPSVRRPSDAEYELPPTPCPSAEEYVTPAFARNYQGVWKYVVQIPQEGYFTQTVQQTKCVKNRCEFMDGVCHESPRWVSLLVAETYYPDTFFPTVSPVPATQAPPPIDDFYNFQQYLKRRVGQADAEPEYSYRSRKYQEMTNQQCDGVDHIGCYVVRLYYDWFLINGSCKCWKPSPKRILTGR